MKEKETKQTPVKPEPNPRAVALSRMLSFARLIRKQGSPDEADEALGVERMISKRLEEVSKQQALAA